ncbi:hypothetical protein ACMGE6_06830 [Macrococcus equi]|uniref:hypothetical protein n=1 Tax=Macrococcus equi TaxID=3395462 RepID=UPI0039BE87C7
MAHVHLLAAWQNNDIEKISQIIDRNIETHIISSDGIYQKINYDELNAGIKKYLEETERHELEWQFDVMHKTERGTANIVVIKISRGDTLFNVSERAALCVFTFDNVEKNQRKMIRAYIEKGVANN